jgi:hypothetical protein
MEETDNPILDQLNDVDKKLLKLKYSNRKLSLTQLGQLQDPPISKQAVYQRMNKKSFKAAWDILEKDVIEQLKSIQNKAISVLITSLGSADEKIRVSTAKFILEPILTNCSGYLPEPIENMEELEFVSEEDNV